MKANLNSGFDLNQRSVAIRSAAFFSAFFLAGLIFGGWLTYNFGWGANSEDDLHQIGFALGLLMLAFSAPMFCFAFAIIRKLRISSRGQ